MAFKGIILSELSQMVILLFFISMVTGDW